MASLRILVVGAGIVGVNCAWRLRREGHEVTLLDRQEPGHGASFGNACMISPGAVVPYASPSTLREIPRWLLDPLGPLSVRWASLPSSLPWLLAWVRSSAPEQVLRGGRAMAALHTGAIEDYRAILAEIGAPELLRRAGQLQVTKSGKLATTGLAARLREEAGIETRLLGPGELREMVPALSPAFTQGLYFPNNGQTVNALKLTTAIAEDFVRQGGRILRRDVRELRLASDGTPTLLADGDLAAHDRVVIAAGMGARTLLKPLGFAVPLQAERGYHLTFTDPGISLPFPIANRDRSFAVTPIDLGIRMAGTAEIADDQASPDWRRAEILKELGRDMFPGLGTEAATRWMGSRPSLPDGLPILGPLAPGSRILLAFGNGHFGMTAAPMMAQVTAALAAGREPPIDIEELSIARFARRSRLQARQPAAAQA